MSLTAIRGATVAGVVLALVMGVLAVSPALAATWSAQATPEPSTPANSTLTNVSCVSAAFCMAVGVSDSGTTSTGGAPTQVDTFAEQWNGSGWSILPMPAAGSKPLLTAVSCGSATYCVAVGYTQSDGRNDVAQNFGVSSSAARALVEVWNGVSWTVATTPASSYPGGGLDGVSCPTSSFCLAVGSHGPVRSDSNSNKPLAEAWNGTNWSMQDMVLVAYGTYPLAASCTAADACTAVGWYNIDKTGVAGPVPLVERLNGDRWTVVQHPSGDVYTLTGVQCLSRSFCLASGVTAHAQNGDPLGPYAAQWNGTRWLNASVGLPSSTSSPLYGVSCLSSSDCFAVGQFAPSVFPPPDQTQPLVENWTGNRWSRVALPAVPAPPGNDFETTGVGYLDPTLFAVSCVLRSGCTAVGSEASGSDGEGSATLAQSDLGVLGAAPALAITQDIPTSASIPRGTGYNGQVNVFYNTGSVRFTENPSLLSGDVVVSPTGAITAAALPPGTYTVTGNESDTSGDTGTWQFTLNVSTLPPAARPVIGVSATVLPVFGTVLVELPGTSRYVPLPFGSTIPLGSLIDTTHGEIRITTANSRTATQAGLFHGGIFRITQTRASSAIRGGITVDLTVLTLAGPLPACAATATAARAKPKTKAKRKTQSLWGNAHGNYRTIGTNASATVRGTEWLTEDTCSGTLIRVTRGVVSVDDFPHHRSFLLAAPHSFLAHRGPGG